MAHPPCTQDGRARKPTIIFGLSHQKYIIWDNAWGDGLVRWEERRRNKRDEWTVIDLLRNYRICHYNHDTHAGAHLHAPIEGPAFAHVHVGSEAEASQIIRAYAQSHDAFDMDSFQEVVRRWKSESKSA